MTAPAMKTLRVSLVDLEITPAGPGGTIQGEVWAKLSSQVRTVDGQVVVLAAPRRVVGATGIVDFEVPANDDAGISADDRGFGVTVGWDLTSRGPRGSTVQVLNTGVTILVTSADPAVTLFAAKVPAVPTDALSAYPTEGDVDTKISAARIVPRWAPTTTYALGQQILSPNSDVVKANTAHTSAGAYATDVAKWDLSVTDVRKGAQLMWLDDQAGVATDGTTECGTAIQSAITAAEAAGVALVAARRVYVTASTLTFTKSADFYESTIGYTGTGTAVVIGDDVSGITRQNIRIGRVVATAKTNPGWAQVAGSVGVKIVDTTKSEITLKSITMFETGTLMLGHLRGCTYNKVYVGELITNKVNMLQTTDNAAGYVNQNKIIGGSWNHDPTASGGTGIAGTRHVVQTGAFTFTPDTNLFSGCSFESPDVAEYFIESYGTHNAFRDCRWEKSTGGPSVWWRTGSYSNAIRDGFKPWLIVVTNDGDLDNVVTWPKSGDIASIVIQPQNMFAAAGTPTLAAVVRHPVMNAVVNDVVAFTTRLPPNWHTYDVELHLVQDTVSTGTVQFLWRTVFATDADTLATPAGGTARTVTVAAQKVKKVATIETGIAATANKQLTANLVASGGTFANTIGILAIVLRRRS
jgi:hypothetical protein